MFRVMLVTPASPDRTDSTVSQHQALEFGPDTGLIGAKCRTRSRGLREPLPRVGSCPPGTLTQ